MCADEQYVFTKVNADLQQVARGTCVKDNTAMVAKVGDLSSTGQAGKEEERRKGESQCKRKGGEKESR